jgi:translation elongation factor EF-G
VGAVRTIWRTRWPNGAKSWWRVIAEADDELIEKYLEQGELSPGGSARGLVAAVRKSDPAPVCCGAGRTLIGVPQLLDISCDLLPSPANRGPSRPGKLRTIRGDSQSRSGRAFFGPGYQDRNPTPTPVA